MLDALKQEDYYWNIGFYALVAAGVGHLFFIPLFFFLDATILAFINIFSVLVYFYALFYAGLEAIQTKDDKFIGWLIYIELLTHGIAASYYLGLESGFYYYIYFLAITPFFTLSYSPQIRVLRLIGIVFISIFLNIYLNNHIPPIVLNETLLSFMGNVNLFVFLFTASVLSYLYTLNSNTYQKRLLHYSIIDPLTELYNRRYLMNRAEQEMAQSLREHKDISLLVIDIDNFKNINDTYGHTAGDQVIIKVAQTLMSTMRPENIIARWGGEEFVILLPNCNAKDLEKIASRLLSAIRKEITTYKKQEILITVTIGGATLDEKKESFSQFISKADKALYKGKENGKNCFNI